MLNSICGDFMNENIRLINKKEVRCIFKKQWYYKLDDVIKYFDIKNYKITNGNLILDYYMPFKIEVKKININYVRHLFLDNKNFIKLMIISNNKNTTVYKEYLYKIMTERINEIINPELAIDKVKTIYYKKGLEVKYYFYKSEYVKNDFLINNKIKNNNELFYEDLEIKLLD